VANDPIWLLRHCSHLELDEYSRARNGSTRQADRALIRRGGRNMDSAG